MSLLARFVRRGFRSDSWPQIPFSQWAEMLTFNGLTYGVQPNYSMGRNVERVGAGYQSIVEGAYRSNGVVFACCAARMLAFSEATFKFRAQSGGRPGKLFGTRALAPLEMPYPGGTTGDLLARMSVDADLAGNWFGIRQAISPEEVRIFRARPDWMVMVLGSRRRTDTDHPTWQYDAEVIGYVYYPGGIGVGTEYDPRTSKQQMEFDVLMPEQVAHFAPVPDPLCQFRGQSWIPPVVNEITGHAAATQHKLAYFEQGATPNVVVTVGPEAADPEQFQKWVDAFEEEHEGLLNAYKTIYLASGSSVEVVGNSLKDLAYRDVQGHDETLIAACAQVPAIIAGFSEGLDASTYCLPASSRVWTVDGPRPIVDLRPSDAVWSYVDGGVEARRVVEQACVGEKAIYTLKTRNRELRATGNHPVLVRVPGNSAGGNATRSATVEWRRLDEIRRDDFVVQPLGLPDQGGSLLPDGREATAEVMQWLGAMIGDGTVGQRGGVRMCMPKQDRVCAHYEAIPPRLFTKERQGRSIRLSRRAQDGLTERMVEMRERGMTFRQIRDALGLSMHPMSVRDRVHIATREYRGEREPVVVRDAYNAFGFGSREAAQWHKRMGVTGTARTKRVPRWVFGLREELRLAFLAGIVDSDGSIGRNGVFAVGFANRELLEDVRMLAISCGIQCCNVSHHVYKASVLPNPGRQDEYESWSFVASSAVEVARIPFADPVYRERVEVNTHRHRPGGKDAVRAGLRDGLGFFRVVSVEVGEPEPVYDIEVEGGHSFIAEGVVVHNSNFAQARRKFADFGMRPYWRNAAASLARIIDVPPGAQLWYDDRDVAFLREDAKDQAEIMVMQSTAAKQLVEAGYEPISVREALLANDMGLLEHTGLTSSQLKPPEQGVINGNGGGVKPKIVPKSKPQPQLPAASN